MEDKILEEEFIEAPEAADSSEEETRDTQEFDYERLIEEDLAELRNAFPELKNLSDISELQNPTRYGALRDLGLSPEEAYRATTKTRAARSDNRAHLRSSAPRHASSPASAISYRDMEIARSIFSDISDAEIQRLYKKVTK